MAEGTPEPTPRIERPVTRDILQKAADAGYVEEVYMSIRLADKPLLATEGAALISRAIRVGGERLSAEADVLDGLAGQSDDPEWQALFAPRATEVRARAQAAIEGADRRDAVIREHPQV